MNKKVYIVFGLVLLIAVVYFYWRKAVAANSLSYSFGLPQSFQFRDASIYFRLPIRVLNPYPESLRISGINLQTTYNGNYLGTCFSLQPQTIAALAETTIMADWFIPIVNIINVVPEIRQASKTLKINFYGSIRAFGLGFPVDYTQVFTLPRINL